MEKVGMATVCIDYLEAMGNHGGVMLTESSEIAAPVEKLLQQFSELFTDELGCCSEIVGISVRPEADLKVFPFRRPPMHASTGTDREGIGKEREKPCIRTSQHCSMCFSHSEHC